MSRRPIAALVLSALVLLSGCSSTPAPEEAPAAGADDLVVKVTMLKPPQTADYLAATAVRMPAGLNVPKKHLIRYGNLACKYSRNYVTGSIPNPGDRLMKEVIADGYGKDAADKIVYATRNASLHTLCNHDIVTAAEAKPR